MEIQIGMKMDSRNKIVILAAMVLALSGIAFAACPTGMISYWTFDSGNIQGSLVKDTLELNNGNLVGAVQTSDAKIGQALNCINGYVDITTTNFPMGNSPRTVELWAKLASTSDFNHPFSYGYGYTPESPRVFAPRFVMGGTQVGVDTYNDGFYVDYPISAGVWYYMVIAYDGTYVKVYMNGKLIGVSGDKSYWNTVQNSLHWICRANHYADWRFYGNVDEVAIYNRPLTDGGCSVGQMCGGEIAAHYNNGAGENYCTGQAGAPPIEICNNGIDDDLDGLTDCADTMDCSADPACQAPSSGCPDGMVSYWRLNGASGSTAADSKDGNPGELQGGASFSEGVVNIPLNGRVWVPMDSGSNIRIAGPSSHEMWINVQQYLPSGVGRMLSYRSSVTNHALSLGATNGAGGIPQGNIGLCMQGWCWANTGVHLNLNTWYYIVMNHENDNRIKIYVNGQPVYTTSPLTFDFSSLTGFEIGRDGEGIGAKFRDVAIYSRPLTQDEITIHYNGGVPIAYCAEAAPNLIQNSTGGTVAEQGITVTVPPGALPTSELLVTIVQSTHSFAPVAGTTVIGQPLDIGPQCVDITSQSTCASTNGCQWTGSCTFIPFESPVTISMPGDCSGTKKIYQEKIAKYIGTSWVPVVTCTPINRGGGFYSCTATDGRLATWNQTSCMMSVQTLTFSSYAAIEGLGCAEGETQSCYTGPEGTEGVGPCAAGMQSCEDGQWGACTGAVVPIAEMCDGDDNNCDGTVDNVAEVNTPNCSKSAGVCEGLKQVCSGGSWTDCTESDYQSHSQHYSIIENTVDTCWDSYDNDCNGLADRYEPNCQVGGAPLQTCTVDEMMDFNNDGTVDVYDAIMLMRQVIMYPNQQVATKPCKAVAIIAQ